MVTEMVPEGSLGMVDEQRLRIMFKICSFNLCGSWLGKRASDVENSLTSTVSGVDGNQQWKAASLPWLFTNWTRLL